MDNSKNFDRLNSLRRKYKNEIQISNGDTYFFTCYFKEKGPWIAGQVLTRESKIYYTGDKFVTNNKINFHSSSKQSIKEGIQTVKESLENTFKINLPKTCFI